MQQTAYLRRLRRWLTLYSTLLAGTVMAVVCAAAFCIACRQYRDGKQAEMYQVMQQAWAELNQEIVSHPQLRRIEQQEQVYLFCWVNGNAIRMMDAADDSSRRSQLQQLAQEGAEKNGIELGQNVQFSQQQTQTTVRLDGCTYECLVWKGPLGDGTRGLALLSDKTPQTIYLWKLGACFAALAAAGIAAIAAAGWLVAGHSIKPAAQAAKRQAEFVAAAGHELRTPLAVLRASTSALVSRPDKAAHYAAAIDAQCVRLAELVNDLLLLAGSDAARLTLQLRPTEPDLVLLDTMEQMEPLAQRAGVALSCDLPPDSLGSIPADAARLQQVLTILVDNALRYAPPGSMVTLGASRQGQWLTMWVQDHGPGIPDEEKEAVFRRFYRVDRTRGGQHFGLGLAVATELAGLHSGELSVRDTPGGGATFVLRLPVRSI